MVDERKFGQIVECSWREGGYPAIVPGTITNYAQKFDMTLGNRCAGDNRARPATKLVYLKASSRVIGTACDAHTQVTCWDRLVEQCWPYDRPSGTGGAVLDDILTADLFCVQCGRLLPLDYYHGPYCPECLSGRAVRGPAGAEELCEKHIGRWCATHNRHMAVAESCDAPGPDEAERRPTTRLVLQLRAAVTEYWRCLRDRDTAIARFDINAAPLLTHAEMDACRLAIRLAPQLSIKEKWESLRALIELLSERYQAQKGLLYIDGREADELMADREEAKKSVEDPMTGETKTQFLNIKDIVLGEAKQVGQEASWRLLGLQFSRLVKGTACSMICKGLDPRGRNKELRRRVRAFLDTPLGEAIFELAVSGLLDIATPLGQAELRHKLAHELRVKSAANGADKLLELLMEPLRETGMAYLSQMGTQMGAGLADMGERIGVRVSGEQERPADEASPGEQPATATAAGRKTNGLAS